MANYYIEVGNSLEWRVESLENVGAGSARPDGFLKRLSLNDER